MASAAAITVVAVAGAAGFGPGGVVRTERTAAQISLPSGSGAEGGTADTEATSADDTPAEPTASDTSDAATDGAPDPHGPLDPDGPSDPDGPPQLGSSDTGNAVPGAADSAGSGTSAEPALPARSGTGKRVVYDISDQRVWLVRGDGTVASTYRVSGSRIKGLVDPGRYQVYSTSRHAVSYDYAETMNYMVRFTQGRSAAIGFHDIPRYIDGDAPVQSRQELGTPLSAGCVRQRRADAKRLWEFAPVGTTVVVTA
jgi:lipoprotein-anchoring transpeptidase ErfK/SrfK